MKIIIILLFLSCTALTRAQTTMTFHLQNGETLSYDLDSISSIDFNGDTSQYPQYEMQMHPDTGWGTENSSEYGVGPDDSMWVTMTNGPKTLNVFLAIGDLAGSGPVSQYAIATIDSITVFPLFAPLDTNSSVIELPEPANTEGYYTSAIWNGNRIYNAYPLAYYRVDSNLSSDTDKAIAGDTIYSSFSAKSDKSSLLFITGGIETTKGMLDELDTATNSITIIDSDNTISRAYYYGDSEIIYYSYGSYSSSETNPPDAGYYLYNRNSGAKSILLSYISNIGPNEMVNGFDVSPDGQKLLIPVVRANEEPLAFEYNIGTKTFDTLAVSFDSTVFGVRPALWLQYNHAGTKILYDNYPLGSTTPIANQGNFSEVGIIDRATLTKQRLRTNPVNAYVGISLFPAWSPDESQIVYSFGKLAGEDGSVGLSYRVCVLTNLQ